ncbi:MAG: hypothetical protein FVQ76_13620, partial [Nitrospira sp.]|nr:hypothetical protein [Nitrospira sp.]
MAEPLAEATITCDGEGVTTSDNARLRYQNLRRPIYPPERINAPEDAPRWSSGAGAGAASG